MNILVGIAFIAGGVLFYLKGSPKFQYLFKNNLFIHSQLFKSSKIGRTYYRIAFTVAAIGFILIGLKFIFNNF